MTLPQPRITDEALARVARGPTAFAAWVLRSVAVISTPYPKEEQ